MKLSWFDTAILALTILGAFTYMRVQGQLAALHREQASIEAAVGRMEITDPNVLHIKALDTGNPWQWAWRVYTPDNSRGTMMYKVGSSSSGSIGFGGSRQEFVARLSMIETQGEHVGLFVKFAGGSGYSTFGSKKLMEFLNAHRDEIIIEQLGTENVETFKRGDPERILLRLAIPKELVEEARKEIGGNIDPTYLPNLLEMTLDIP